MGKYYVKTSHEPYDIMATSKSGTKCYFEVKTRASAIEKRMSFGLSRDQADVLGQTSADNRRFLVLVMDIESDKPQIIWLESRPQNQLRL